ncbi:hypothetical protein ACS0TY_034541 [Phlomoides rotata]
MNTASKIAAKINFQANPFQLRASLFHCTPVSERRRRPQWDYENYFGSSSKRFTQYRKRLRKQSVLRNVSEFAEHLFQSWRSDEDESEQSPGRGSSWFRPNSRDNGFGRGKSRNRTSRRDFEFVDEYDEFETIFRSTFGGRGYSYWYFTGGSDPRSRNSSSYSSKYRTSSGWKYEFEDEYEDYYSSSETMDTMSSDRLALGLSSSGPLNLEDVKNAYRECALKWHPDRHQGSSKAVAEEKFKVCSAAYQSLCDKLALH